MQYSTLQNEHISSSVVSDVWAIIHISINAVYIPFAKSIMVMVSQTPQTVLFQSIAFTLEKEHVLQKPASKHFRAEDFTKVSTNQTYLTDSHRYDRLLKKKKKKKVTSVKGRHVNNTWETFSLFSPKHNKQDYNNIKIHWVQANNRLRVITINTRERGDRYYSENRRKCKSCSIFSHM